MFCSILEGKNAESSAEDGGLACEVSEESKDSTGLFVQGICSSGWLELKNLLCLIRHQNYQSETSALLGYSMLVSGS